MSVSEDIVNFLRVPPPLSLFNSFFPPVLSLSSHFFGLSVTSSAEAELFTANYAPIAPNHKTSLYPTNYI